MQKHCSLRCHSGCVGGLLLQLSLGRQVESDHKRNKAKNIKLKQKKRICPDTGWWAAGTYCIIWFLADLRGVWLSLSSWRLRYRRLSRGRFTRWRLNSCLLNLAGLLTSSWSLGWSRAGWSLCSLLGGGADHRRRCGLLLDGCLWLDVSLVHWGDCCCSLCSCSSRWLHTETVYSWFYICKLLWQTKMSKITLSWKIQRYINRQPTINTALLKWSFASVDTFIQKRYLSSFQLQKAVFRVISQCEPASAGLQPEWSCFVAGWVAELEPVPSVTAELQLAERGLSWLLWDVKNNTLHMKEYGTLWYIYTATAQNS